MAKTTITAVALISSAGMLLASLLAPSAGAGGVEDMTARVRALLPARSPISAEMSARTVALALDEYATTTELPSVHFEFASATIRAADRRTLDANADWLKANQRELIAIEGAADPRGSREYNLALGERRAKAVKDYLIGRGVAPERITILSAGEARQACRGRDCWSLDRRVDFLVKKLRPQAP